MSGLSLRWRIGALVLLGLAAIFTLFGVLGSELARDGRQRTIGQWVSLTSSTARFIDAELEAQFDRLTALAARLDGGADDAARWTAFLDDTALQPSTFIVGTFLLDARGALRWTDPALAGGLPALLASDARITDPLRSGGRYASGVRDLGGRPTVVLAVPVPAPGGRAAGVLGTVIRPDAWVVDDLVSSARGLANSGHAELIDQEGQVIVSSEPGRALAGGEHPDFYAPLLAHHGSGVGLTEPVGALDPADQGERHEMAFVSLSNAPWGLALGGADAELSADANRWQTEIATFGALTLFVALLLVWITTRSVARPIRALTAASRSIAAGDLTTPVPRGGEGEVRELAAAFDHMRRELQAALSSLALEESRYEGIVTSMADAVVTTDKDLRITALNPAAARLTGWRIGDTAPGASAEPGTGVTKEIVRTPDGRLITMATTRSAIRDQSGQIAGLVHVLRDVSAEEEVHRLKDEFLSTVSHELRTPLGFIMGYATTLLLPDAPDDKAATRRCVEVIADASKELQELVDNLLDMTKIGAGSLSVSPAPTRLDVLANAAVERLGIRAKGHRLHTAIETGLPRVWADPHRVEQVLYNLVDNAIKYSPDGGAVEVRAQLVGEEVLVSVVDEGLGIPADELPTVFERFHRGKNARARGIGGTGLGLAICRGIVLAHGGRIWADSPAPQADGAPRGAAIHFTLPVATLHAARRSDGGMAVAS
ncbi:MAG TPA: ATP-binding protein [Candidatus Limnocylindria bacterium]|nr:ATP-binding protein [Candidatus Limnocylindria bacterium]